MAARCSALRVAPVVIIFLMSQASLIISASWHYSGVEACKPIGSSSFELPESYALVRLLTVRPTS